MALKNIIQSEDELRALMGGAVAPSVVEKTLSHLDKHCLKFIERAPFILIASSNREGRMDISPKGDAPGFVRVLDEHTLAIPERPGNQRFDTFCNLLQSPRIGLIFLIPGKTETLRVGGSASIVNDPDLLSTLSEKGKTPALATVVTVDEAFFHCSKCMLRSNLWNQEKWPTLEGLPTLAETMKDAAKIPAPIEAIAEIIRDDEKKRLY